MKPSSGPASPPMPPRAERSTRRDALHLALVAVPWVGVGWLWWRVGLDTSSGQLLQAAVLVLVLVAISVPLNLAWVLYNVRLFRRKGGRTELLPSPFDYSTDWTRRPVVADWPAVQLAPVVVVLPAAEAKVFLSREVADGTDPIDPGAAPAETAPPMLVAS